MQDKVKRVVSVIMTVLLTGLMINCASNILERKESDFKYRDFFAQDENFDVLFLGSSHMINGVYPYELWDDYGIVSYNLGAHGASPAVSYWVLMNSLNYTTPKLVVLDCLYASWQQKVPQDFEQIHKPFDAFPLSRTKIAAINDMIEGNTEHNKYELIWDFSLYHNRWNQFEEWDFTLPYNTEMGGETRIDIAEPMSSETIADDIKCDSDTVSAYYIRQTIEECQKRDIDVLLIYLPYPANEESQAEANMVSDIAKEYGVSYINFLKHSEINYNIDMYDSDSHLNPSGAKKVTYSIGEYIKDNYDIPDHRGDALYANWSSGWEEYYRKKQGDFMYETSPYIYMTLMADNDVSVDLDLYNEEIYQDEVFSQLIENIDYHDITSRSNPYDYDVDMCLTVMNSETEEIIEKSLFNYQMDESGYASIEMSRDYNW